ncbi:MAG: exodeoxyribonuclease VII large subunit [Oscillospiraceae bacterium]|nr:exodeoxyribonuclease VII large subunit [Oscillospiraceae bacterium]
MDEPERNAISVSRLNIYMSKVVSHLTPLQQLTVSGEISNFRRYASGHCYFSLKDEKAAVSCVMFAQAAHKLNFKPADGMAVLADCRADFYTKTGTFQLQIANLEEAGTGELYRRFEQLKAKLAREGLFDQAHKRPLPFLPRRIGVVTSPTGAVIRDIINVLNRRNSHYELILAPALVQGDRAKDSIVAGIRQLNSLGNLDVLIVGRGGGSIEDLWPFNEEAVARAVYASAVPVISAVGHETDFTICDFAADRRAPTPSAAAEIAMPEYEQLEQLLHSRETQLKRGLLQQLRLADLHLERLAGSKVLRDPAEIIRVRQLQLRQLTQTLYTLSPQRRLEQREQELDQAIRGLSQGFNNIITVSDQRLSAAAWLLNDLSPLKVLGRGYALALDQQQRPVTSVKTLLPGDSLELILADGRVQTQVREIEDIKHG